MNHAKFDIHIVAVIAPPVAVLYDFAAPTGI